MISYKDITKFFGLALVDINIQSFLTNLCSDLTDYNVLESNYITSEQQGIEFGFTNNEAVYDDDENVVFEKGNPIFSHFILYPKSICLVDKLPFDTTFYDKRMDVIKKAGKPTQTNEGFVDFLNRNFLIDNYKKGNIVVTFDFDFEKQTINFIQVRDNNLVEHLKL